MRILLCAATEMEIAPTILAVSTKDRHHVQFLVTGVGLMACTYALTKELSTNRPDFVVQAGVAGSLSSDLSLGDVVAVRNECIGDLGATENGQFRSIFDLSLLSPDIIPWQKGKLINDNSLLNFLELPVVDGVTVNEISTSTEKIDYYKNKLAVQTESMEGAALHYTALLEKIPFLQIRSLSNFIGERDKTKWQMKKAISNLNIQLQHIFAKLETL